MADLRDARELVREKEACSRAEDVGESDRPDLGHFQIGGQHVGTGNQTLYQEGAEQDCALPGTPKAMVGTSARPSLALFEPSEANSASVQRFVFSSCLA